MDWGSMKAAIAGLLGLLATAPAWALHDLPGEAVDPRRLVLGRVSDDPRSVHPRLAAVAALLATRLGDVGITSGAAIVARDNQDMLRLLRQGKVDLVSETPYSALQYVDEGSADILLRERKWGEINYRAVFFQRADGSINSLSGLNGGKVALEDPGSTTGFFLPLREILKAGLAPVVLASPHDRVGSGEVGYLLLRDELSIAAAVMRGTVDAGVFKKNDRRLRHQQILMQGALVPFHETESVPRSLLLVRRGLNVDLVRRVRQILLDGPQGDAEQESLRRYSGAGGFEEIDVDAWEALNRVQMEGQKIRGLAAP